VFIRRARTRAGVVLGVVVLSHWLLDVASHRPDMPITLGGSIRIGLGLWNSLTATIAVEGLLFAVGVSLYARSTRARSRAGTWALWSLVACLVAICAANLFGPPPPDGMSAAWTALALWLLVIWGYWIDRHRQPLAARA
jgi:hypothetical protein